MQSGGIPLSTMSRPRSPPMSSVFPTPRQNFDEGESWDQAMMVNDELFSSNDGVGRDDDSTIGSFRSSSYSSVRSVQYPPCREVEELDEGDVTFSRTPSSLSSLSLPAIQPQDGNQNMLRRLFNRPPLPGSIKKVGPWGFSGRFPFDHNGHDGIKTIRISSGWVVDSIEVEYIKRGEVIRVAKSGGVGGSMHEIALEDGEYINKVTGFHGRLDGLESINSITFFTNRGKTYGPYGLKNGTMRDEIEKRPIPFQVRKKQIVGFHGTTNYRFVSSIGFYVSPIV